MSCRKSLKNRCNFFWRRNFFGGYCSILWLVQWSYSTVCPLGDTILWRFFLLIILLLTEAFSSSQNIVTCCPSSTYTVLSSTVLHHKWGLHYYRDFFRVKVSNALWFCITTYLSMGWVVHGASCPWWELSMGQVVMGRSVHGASCLWGELSMGQAVHGASCPWGKLSMGQAVLRASCPWGELSMRRVVMRRVVMGQVSMGRVVWESYLQCKQIPKNIKTVLEVNTDI